MLMTSFCRSAAIPINAIHKLESTIRTSLNKLERDSVVEEVRRVQTSLRKEYEDNTNIEEKELESQDWWTSSRHHGKDYSIQPAAPWYVQHYRLPRAFVNP